VSTATIPSSLPDRVESGIGKAPPTLGVDFAVIRIYRTSKVPDELCIQSNSGIKHRPMPREDHRNTLEPAGSGM
jgi:hypothetical protein